ncbi:hypothetical protein N2152v2_004185 [Parachlorella kessleri]
MQQCSPSDVRSKGARGDGGTDDANAFQAVDQDGNAGVIFMGAGTYRIGRTMTLTKSIIAAAGAVFKVDGGVTLTLYNQPQHPLNDNFFTGAGTVLLTTGTNYAVPEWFGARADGTTDDSAAVQKAYNAIQATGNAYLYLKGTYGIGPATQLQFAPGGLIMAEDTAKFVSVGGQSRGITFTTGNSGPKSVLPHLAGFSDFCVRLLGVSLGAFQLKTLTNCGDAVRIESPGPGVHCLDNTVWFDQIINSRVGIATRAENAACASANCIFQGNQVVGNTIQGGAGSGESYAILFHSLANPSPAWDSNNFDVLTVNPPNNPQYQVFAAQPSAAREIIKIGGLGALPNAGSKVFGPGKLDQMQIAIKHNAALMERQFGLWGELNLVELSGALTPGLPSTAVRMVNAPNSKAAFNGGKSIHGTYNTLQAVPDTDWYNGEPRAFYFYHQAANGFLYQIKCASALASNGLQQVDCLQYNDQSGSVPDEVLGEALAFALGGNSKMLRAKNLGSLVNNDLAGRGHHQVAAQVTVHFSICGTVSDQQEMAKPADEQQQQQQLASQRPAPVQGGYLGVRRRVTRSGRSDFLICRSDKVPETLADQRCNATAAAEAGTTTGVGDRWTPVSPEVLRQQLAEFGIQTQAIDRMVVTQHRQAVNVQDPVKLAGFLELLIGTAAYQEQVEALRAQVRETCAEQDTAEDEVSRLELRRRQLAPEVAKWHKYEAAQRQHAEQQALVLGHQVGLLKTQTQGLQSQVGKLASELKEADDAEAEAKGEAARLKAEKATTAEERTAAEAVLRKLTKQVEAQQLETARLEVRLKTAQRAAKKGAGASGDAAWEAAVGEEEEEKLQELDAQVASIRGELERRQRAEHELAEEEAILAGRVAEQSGSGTLDKLQASMAALQQQLAALNAAISAYKLGLEQHQATASSTEKALHQHAAAEGPAQTKWADAEQAAAALQQATEARRRQLCCKEEALQEAEAQLHACQAQEHHMQQDLQALILQLDQLTLPDRSEGAICGEQQRQRGSISKQNVAQAIAELTEQAAKHAGKFHGRICNVARLAQPQAATAVNAVLVESCNLSTCFVVSTRAVAQRVVEHFRQHQVGMATCKILDELREPARDAATSDGLLPLQQLVDADTLQAPGSKALLSVMLRNWYLAPDRQAAVSAMRQDRRAGTGRRRNIVTAQGELFKADGELVGARQPPKAVMPLLLSSTFQPLSKSAGTSEQEAAEQRSRLQQETAHLAPRLQQCQQQFQQLTGAVEVLAAETEALRGEQQADAAKYRAMQQVLGRERKVLESKLQQRRATLERELQQAKRAESVAAEGMAAAVQQRQKLEEQLAVMEREYASAAEKLQGGSKLLKERAELETVRARLEEERSKASALDEQLTSMARRRSQLDKLQRAALAAAAEISQLEQKLQSQAQSAAAMEAQLQQKGGVVAELRKRAARVERDCKVAAKNYEQALGTAQQLQEQLRGQQQALQAQQGRLKRAKAALEAAQQAVARLATEQLAPGSTKAAVCITTQEVVTGGPLDGYNAEGELEAADSEGEGGSSKKPKRLCKQSAGPAGDMGKEPLQRITAGTEKHGRGGFGSQMEGDNDSACEQYSEPDSEHSGGSPARRPRQAVASCRGRSRQQNAIHSSSGSDHGPDRAEGSTRPSKGRQPAAKQRFQHGSSRSLDKEQHDDEGQGGPEAWDDGVVEEAFEELERQYRSLQELHASLLEGALESDRQAEAALTVKLAEVDALEEQVQRLVQEKDALETERYSRFHSALLVVSLAEGGSAQYWVVNTKLSTVYQQLTGGQGDAYCSYIEDRLAAFTNGVTFHVRPDSSRWRSFSILSGGQQALATLALCFAVQAACPSPFYFFDEVDCALDTVNAGRLADYIRSRSDTQYLVVSHKPQVYEKADSLVGVYTCGPGSDAVTIHCPRVPQG